MPAVNPRIECNGVVFFLIQFCIYAEIKLNCVKLNNIEISIVQLLDVPSDGREKQKKILYFERFMAYALNNFHSLHGINVCGLIFIAYKRVYICG